MSIVAALLCRLDSSRLPGKVLMNLGSQSLIEHIYNAIQSTESIIPVVATTDRKCDDPIERLCSLKQWNIYRGSIHPLIRIQSVLKEKKANCIFRVNCDSPFVDLSLFEDALRLMANHDVDMITNLMPRSFPYGVTVQLIRRNCLHNIEDASIMELEHITPYLERKCFERKISYLNIDSQIEPSAIANLPRLTIDNLSNLIHLSDLLRNDGSLPPWTSLL